MSKPDTWMPLYVGDYIADTMHLNTEQHGAYLLLLMTAWNRGGKLPSDEAQLALICRCDKKSWSKLRDVVLPFFELKEGYYIQHRLAAEYAKAVKINDAQKANGAKGGRPKKTQQQTQDKPMGFDSLNPNKTPSPSPLQVNPEVIVSGVHDPNVGTPGGAVCALLKTAGIVDVNPMHPRLLALLDAGLTVEEIAAVGPEAKTKGKGFAWLLATAEGRRRDASNVKQMPSFAATDDRLSPAGRATAEAAKRWLESQEATA